MTFEPEKPSLRSACERAGRGVRGTRAERLVHLCKHGGQKRPVGGLCGGLR